jgi:N-terminal region of Chorein or VPS13
MAKRLLLDILVKVLGEYIELDADNFNLDMAVWSGHIALKNLKVSSCMANRLKLSTDCKFCS